MRKNKKIIRVLLFTQLRNKIIDQVQRKLQKNPFVDVKNEKVLFNMVFLFK